MTEGPSGAIKGRTITGRSDRVVKNPEIPFSPEIPDVELDIDLAFGIPIETPFEKYTVVVIPAAGVFRGDLASLLRKPRTFGAIITCLQEVWTIESEPTGEDTFGLLVYSERRKPLISGRGRVVEDSFEWSLATVYDNVRSSPRADSVSGSGKCNTNGVCEVGITYTVSF
jgi:hypothetical protein